jgi:hypothetical protein
MINDLWKLIMPNPQNAIAWKIIICKIDNIRIFSEMLQLKEYSFCENTCQKHCSLSLEIKCRWLKYTASVATSGCDAK